MGEENGPLSPFEWFKHLLTEGGSLGQLISHARFQALDSNRSIRTLVATHEEEAAVSMEFPLERKEGQPSRWNQAKGGGTRGETGLGTGLGFGVTPAVHPVLSLSHKLEHTENGV